MLNKTQLDNEIKYAFQDKADLVSSPHDITEKAGLKIKNSSVCNDGLLKQRFSFALENLKFSWKRTAAVTICAVFALTCLSIVSIPGARAYAEETLSSLIGHKALVLKKVDDKYKVVEDVVQTFEIPEQDKIVHSENVIISRETIRSAENTAEGTSSTDNSTTTDEVASDDNAAPVDETANADNTAPGDVTASDNLEADTQFCAMLAEAQKQVPYPIKTPKYLPDSSLSHLSVNHYTRADGRKDSMISLDYRRGGQVDLAIWVNRGSTCTSEFIDYVKRTFRIAKVGEKTVYYMGNGVRVQDNEGYFKDADPTNDIYAEGYTAYWEEDGILYMIMQPGVAAEDQVASLEEILKIVASVS